MLFSSLRFLYDRRHRAGILPISAHTSHLHRAPRIVSPHFLATTSTSFSSVDKSIRFTTSCQRSIHRSSHSLRHKQSSATNSLTLSHEKLSEKSRDMSQSTPPRPTYDKAHYSWAPPSTQSSQSIIKSSDSAAEGENASDPTHQGKPQTAPVIPRRSSYNYAQDSAQFSGLGNHPLAGSPESGSGQAGAKVSDSDVDGLQKKLFHQRQKSYTQEDQKRMQHEFMMRNDNNPQSFSET